MISFVFGHALMIAAAFTLAEVAHSLWFAWKCSVTSDCAELADSCRALGDLVIAHASFPVEKVVDLTYARKLRRALTSASWK